MHEMHLIKDLFGDILKAAEIHDVKRITKVYLKMGEFTEINEEIIRFFFKEHSKGTILEGAELSIEKSQTRELRLISFDCE
jgi:hydrogenase nickel incorporation protein HypA/HybF